MKKRSAMTVAAGLVGALLAGVLAMSLGFAGGPAASAGSTDLKPKVRTIERTVTIHKKAKPKAPQVVMIPAPASSAAQNAPASTAMGSSDDERDDEAVDDDQFEGEHDSEGQDDGGWQEDEGEFEDD